MISEHRRCGVWGWILYNSVFCQEILDVREADFSRLNQSLYLTTFVAYGGTGRSCNHCQLSDHAQEECALRPQRPAQESLGVEGRRDSGKGGEYKGQLKRRGACFAWKMSWRAQKGYVSEPDRSRREIWPMHEGLGEEVELRTSTKSLTMVTFAYLFCGFFFLVSFCC